MKWVWARPCRRALWSPPFCTFTFFLCRARHVTYTCLRYSGRAGPSLVVCPATLVWQWVREMAKWAPPLKRIVIDSSSSAKDIEKMYKLCRCNTPCVVFITYEQVRRRSSEFSFPTWGVIFLDEGHRIRNPDADVTVCCKKLQGARRFILSGSPIQNSLTELWSLMDFVYPGYLLLEFRKTYLLKYLFSGKLSTLPIFKDQFVAPIRLGGFSHATQGQLHVA
jgi:DNA excision repair protein ERCC-6